MMTSESTQENMVPFLLLLVDATCPNIYNISAAAVVVFISANYYFTRFYF